MSFAIDCRDKTARQINQQLRGAIAAGHHDISLQNPDARHNLAVAVLRPVRITIDGSVGYYCGGLNDGAEIHVHGSAGWGTAESMLSGLVIVEGNAGNSAAATIRGGTVVIKGDAGARAGIAMKGGLLVIGGSTGYMTGFMMQKGTIVVCGDAGEALADSMYEGVIYVAGRIAELGNDAVIEEPTADEANWLARTLQPYQLNGAVAFKKVISGRKLWNFDKGELEVWKAAL